MKQLCFPELAGVCRLAVVAFALALPPGEAAEATAADPGLQRVPAIEHPGSNYKIAERGFQGIPGLARAAGGRLWATWYGGGTTEGPDNYVMLVTSADDGRSWSEIQRVVDPPGLLRAYDPGLWVDPQGRLWWFYMQSYGHWDGRAGLWAMTTDDPAAATPRWSPPRRLVDGIMMNKPTVLRNGDWLFPVAIWAQEPMSKVPATDPRYVPPDQAKWKSENVGAHVYRTRNRGTTFEKLGTVRTPDPSPDEHMLVERRDGSLWLLVRTRGGISESTSTDGGLTWTAPQPSSIPHAVSRFFIRRLRSGQLLLVKHASPAVDPSWMQGRRIQAKPQARSHLAAFVSADDGRTWSGGLMLNDRNGVSYPDGDQYADGRIFVIYDRNRKTDREILMAAFTEEDVAAGRLVDQRSALQLLVNSADPPAAWSDGMPVRSLWQAGRPKAGVAGAGFPLLEAAKHATIFQPAREEGAYNHHAELIGHRGKFFAMWSNHPLKEDGPGQRVLYSFSDTPEQWPAWRELFPAPGPIAESTPEGQPRGTFASALMWITRGERLYAVAAVNSAGPIAREVKSDGTFGPIFRLWAREAALPFATLQSDDRSVATIAQEIDALIGTPDFWPWWDFWDKYPSPNGLNGRTLMEPTVHRARGGTYVMLLRDSDRRGYTHRVFVSISRDGRQWPAAQPTDIPDTPSRRDVVRLANGSVLMVGNQGAPEFDDLKPRHFPRDPLTVAVSRDGLIFERAYALRWNLPKTFRVAGVKGRGMGAQYPSAIVQRDVLYVMYTIGKEDVGISWVPLKELGL